MAHVGEEFALVLVGTLQIRGLLREHRMRPREFLLLMFEYLSLLLELSIDLLQFRLLRLQLAAGFP